MLKLVEHAATAFGARLIVFNSRLDFVPEVQR